MLQKLLLTPREAAYQLGGISLRHLWQLSQPRGRLPVVRLGRRVFYRPADLEAFIQQTTEHAAQVRSASNDAGTGQ